MANEKLILHANSDHTDSSGQGHEASITTSYSTSIKKYGSASFSFNGSSEYISFQNSDDWDIFKTVSDLWTIDFWLYQTSADQSTHSIICNQYQDANNWWYFRRGLDASLIWSLYYGAVTTISVNSASSWTADTWHHVCLYKGGNEYGIYVDGVQIAYLSDTSIGAINGVFEIGRFTNGATDYFGGNIDEFRITNANVYNLAPVSGKTDTFTVPSNAPPDPPSSVVATKHATISNRIDVSWTTNTSYNTARCIERKINNRSWVVLSNSLGASIVSYSDTTATESATYYYRVRCYASTYSDYTDYGNSNSVDMTADTKLIAFSDKLLYALDNNTSNGSWEPLPWYDSGSISISGNTVSGSSACKWNTESNVVANYILFQTPSGASAIDYTNPYTISGVASNTSMSLATTPTTGCSAASYIVCKNFTTGESIDFTDYNQKCFMAKQSDIPVYYDMTSIKNMGVYIPSSACSASAVAGSGLETGDYLYKITYLYGDYGESNGNTTAASVTTTAGNQQVNLTNIPIGGKDVTKRYIYRTIVDGSTYYLVDTIEDNTTTTYSDTTSDSTIVSGGTTIPTLHTVPVQLVTLEERNSRFFGVDNDSQYTLRYTPTTKPYAWPSTYTIDRNGKGRLLRIVNAFEALILFFDRGIEMANVDDSTPSNWTFEDIQTYYGLASRQGIATGNGGIYFFSIKDKVPGIQFLRRGKQSVVNATFDSLIPDSLSEKIDNFMKGINTNALETSVMSFYDNKLRLSVPYGSSDTPNKTVIYDFRRDAFSIKTKGYLCFAESSGNLFAGSSNDNYLHQLDYEFTWSDGTSIAMQCTTGYLSGKRKDLNKDFQFMRIETQSSSGTLTVNWNVDNYKLSGSFSLDLSSTRYHKVYFPIGTIGESIQIDFQCTNNVSTVIKNVHILFQLYDLTA